MMFPMLWILGANAMDLLDNNAELVLHSLADIISKSAFLHCGWMLGTRLEQVVRKKEKRLEKKLSRQGLTVEDARSKGMVNDLGELDEGGKELATLGLGKSPRSEKKKTHVSWASLRLGGVTSVVSGRRLSSRSS